MLAGTVLSDRFVLPAEAFNRESLEGGSILGLESVRFFESNTVPVVWFHNLRTIVIATILGAFTFGVLGVVILMIPFLLIGFFTATMSAIGLSPWLFLGAFVLPHGIFEIPAIIFAGAAILRLGASLVATEQGKSFGESWLRSFADWTRVMVALVIPLLLAAAILEVLVTPRIALLIFGQ
jgi:stage II sporulation protein M